MRAVSDNVVAETACLSRPPNKAIIMRITLPVSGYDHVDAGKFRFARSAFFARRIVLVSPGIIR